MNTITATQCARARQSKPALRAFTLVEMMVVVVIMVIVIGIAIPAFQRMNSGSSVRAGTRILASQIRLTRQYAITQRRTVALIMPREEVSKLEDENRYVAMKPAIVEASGSSYAFVSWVDGTQWTRIPLGAVIAEVDGDVGIHDGSGYTKTPSDDSPTLVEIKPTDMKDLQENLSSTTPVQVRAIVFSPTGAVKGLTKANVTVAQLTLNAGSWVVRNAGTDSSSSPDRCTPNQFNINVNTFTGRIKIETPDQY